MCKSLSWSSLCLRRNHPKRNGLFRLCSNCRKRCRYFPAPDHLPDVFGIKNHRRIRTTSRRPGILHLQFKGFSCRNIHWQQQNDSLCKRRLQNRSYNFKAVRNLLEKSLLQNHKNFKCQFVFIFVVVKKLKKENLNLCQ